MSIGDALAHMFGGGLVGFGGAMQTQARDQEQNEARTRLEKLRAELDKDRQMALEEVRHSNNVQLSGQQHLQRKELQTEDHTFRTDLQEKEQGFRKDESAQDRALRERQLAEQVKDREVGRELQERQIGISAGHLGVARDREKREGLESPNAILAKLPPADKAALDAFGRDMRSADAEVSKLMSSQYGLPADDPTLVAARARREEARNNYFGILQKHGYEAPKVDKAGTANSDKAAPGVWDRLNESGRKKALMDLDKLRASNPDEYAAAKKELGVPNDILGSWEKERNGGDGNFLTRGLKGLANMVGTGEPRKSDGAENDGGLVGRMAAENRDPRSRASAARTEAIRSYTPDVIGSMDKDQARSVLDTYKTELSREQRRLLEKRIY